jgi:hypothetical protein
VDCVRTILVLIGFLAISTSFYCWYEGWTMGSSITFIIVTMSTVGESLRCPSLLLKIVLNYLCSSQVTVTPIPPMTTHDCLPSS